MKTFLKITTYICLIVLIPLLGYYIYTQTKDNAKISATQIVKNNVTKVDTRFDCHPLANTVFNEAMGNVRFANDMAGDSEGIDDPHEILTQGSLQYKTLKKDPFYNTDVYFPEIVVGTTTNEGYKFLNEKISEMTKDMTCYDAEYETNTSLLKDEARNVIKWGVISAAIKDTQITSEEEDKISECIVEHATIDELKKIDSYNKTYSGGIEITYADDQYVGLKKSGDYFCGGAYPDAGIDYSVYDIKNKKELDFYDLLNKVRKQKYEYRSELGINQNDWWNIVRKVFAEEFDPARAEEIDCGDVYTKDSILDESYNLDIGIDAKGIILNIEFPHVNQSCDLMKTVSPRVLSDYFDSKSPLKSIFK